MCNSEVKPSREPLEILSVNELENNITHSRELEGSSGEPSGKHISFIL